MRLLISQETYDALCRRLSHHHKAHKGLSEFPAVRSGLERTAHITPDGVEVDIRRLTIAADAIRDNIKFVGEKYGTAPDKTILLDIEDYIEAHQALMASGTLAETNASDDGLARQPDIQGA